MKTLIRAAIRCSLIFIAVTSLFCVRPAEAYMVTLQQVGSNVVATGSGAFNLTGLTFVQTAPLGGPAIGANLGLIQTVQTNGAVVDIYIGFTGPMSFGSGGVFFANTGSGDFVGIAGSTADLGVPQGYVSGAALSSSATWDNATFASLGVTPGTYVWHWGTGLPNQNFTLIIGGAGMPDSGSTVFLLGFGLLGFAALRRRLRC